MSLGFDNKPEVWQEFCKDTDGFVRMIRVEDFGTTKSTRRHKKKTRTETLEENKQEGNLEAENNRRKTNTHLTSP